MKKLSYTILMSAIVGVFSFSLQAAPAQQPAKATTAVPSKPAAPAPQTSDEDEDEDEDEYDILKRNQIDDTDSLAIPFDDSEVEDEEQINRDEKKKVFNIPGAK